MSLVGHTQDVTVDFGWQKVYEALEKAIATINGMSIDSKNEITKTITLKAGVSMFSWGENLTISLSDIGEGKTKISILSTPKTGVLFGGTIDMGKNRKNINSILDSMVKFL